MSLTVKGYAKLNLWLDITGYRGDGYHTLNTVMRRIDLYDDVTVETRSGGDINITCNFPSVPTDGWNIVYRAAMAFFEKMGKSVGLSVDIYKRIPVGAGLGGSSADGAAVLTALNELCGRPLDLHELCTLGATLGADVPFCIAGGTAKCTGIGDIMQPIDCTDLAVVVAVPEFECSTAKAYQRYDADPFPEKPGFDAFCSGIRNDRSFLASNMYNVFAQLYADQRIEELRRKLLSVGAEGACMTGSGSAVFGVFPDIDAAREAAGKLGDCTKFAVRAI